MLPLLISLLLLPAQSLRADDALPQLFSRAKELRVAAKNNEPLFKEPTNDFLKDLSEGFLRLKETHTAPKKTEVLRQVGALPKPERASLDTNNSAGVSGGTYKVFPKIPAGTCVGTGGAGPCIGLIIQTLDPEKSVYVFHFGAIDDPLTTLKKAGPFPKGSRAALFGGDNSEPSNVTLKLAMDYLRQERIKVDGYSNTTGLWVDKDGRYRLTPLDTPSQESVGRD